MRDLFTSITLIHTLLPTVNQTPASFRSIKGAIEQKQGEDILINTPVQKLVIMRPKYYVGSSGSMWASDYMRLCHENGITCIQYSTKEIFCIST